MASPSDSKFFQVETRSGMPLVDGEKTLTPFAQSFTIRIPGAPVRLFWNRPVSVLVQTPDGGEQVLRIRDVTRLAQWSLLLATVTFFMISFWIRPRSKQTHQEE